MSTDDKNIDRAAAVAKLKDVVQLEKGKGAPANLDDLIELLDADDLRNVVGMVRPKGQPGR
jgi:hypothetical protein